MDNPIIYELTRDETCAAFTVADIRCRENRGQSNIPFGETLSVNERLFQSWIACMAEIAVSRHLNMCWTGCGKGSEGGHDVGGCYEVRSIMNRSHGLLIRQKDCDAPYILVYVNFKKGICELIGWETAAGVRQLGEEMDRLTNKPYHLLDQSKLRPLSLLSSEARYV